MAAEPTAGRTTTIARPLSTSPIDTAGAPSGRLLALDVCRGLTMAAMVVVNNPGDWSQVYWPLLHAAWHGWTPTDLIFPVFLFFVGVAITLTRRSDDWRAIVRRALLIFAVGAFLAGFPRFNLETWRVMGVLQRIALCYLAAALFYRWASRRRASPAMAMLVAAAVCLGVHTILLLLVPNPAGVAGDLTPEGNLGAWIDRAVLDGHLWKPRWDPEGLMSTISAVGTTLVGTWTGVRLRGESPLVSKVRLIALAGAGLTIAGLAWGRSLPINKSLWTPSYTLFTAGGGMLLLAVVLWVCDVQGWRKWAHPFVVLGTNALTLFVLSGLVGKLLITTMVSRAKGPATLGTAIYEAVFASHGSTKIASLTFALVHLAALYVVLAWMYRRRIFVRV